MEECMGVFKNRKKTEESKPSETAAEKKKSRMGKSFRQLRRDRPWIVRGAAISIVCAVLFSSCYGLFRSSAEKYMRSPVESAEVISWLYQNCYLLYRDLYNTQHEKQGDYSDIYFSMDEEYQWLLDENTLSAYKKYLKTEMGADSADIILRELADEGLLSAYFAQGFFDEYIEDGSLDERQLAKYILQGYFDQGQMEAYIAQGLLDEELLDEYIEQGFGEDWDAAEEAYPDETSFLTWGELNELKSGMAEVESWFRTLEDNFRNLNNTFDYVIRDNRSGKYVSNMSTDERNRGISDQYFLLSFVFDSAGNVTIADDICGNDANRIRKYANEAVRENAFQNLVAQNAAIIGKYGNLNQPVDCEVTFSISKNEWAEWNQNPEMTLGVIQEGRYSTYVTSYNSNWYTLQAYLDAGIGGILFLCLLFLALLGFLLPMPGGRKPWMHDKICAIPLELLFGIVCVAVPISSPVLEMIAYMAGGKAGGAFSEALMISPDSAAILAGFLNLLALSSFFFCFWYIGVCARAVRELHMREYIKQRSLIYRFFPFMKGRAVDIYEAVAHMDLTRDAQKTIIRVLLVNAVILFFISCLWIGGLAVTLVYTFVLYIILRKYISDLQKRYRILLKAVDEIAEGNLNVAINEDLGVFEPFREQIFKIQDGLQKAVDTEVRSQRMRVELVTNMSHDLKTPLTAIITYINLLKEENVTEEQRREYLATLERKSLRLKSLIEDLFEFSKANSQNITLNIMDVDIMNLVKQVSFEMSDKIKESGLDVRMSLTDERIILPLDSQKTYRIYENLFGNIAKYALPGTRVYVNGFRIDDTVIITLKNISAQEITVETSELTERFVRGDASRNTEGSGLGLAIAKSFMELQGGELSLEVDGDLFKATTTWHIKAE